MATSNSSDDLRWIPVREAAHMLGISRQRVYQLIHEGQVRSVRVGCTYMVLKRSVEARIAMLEREGDDFYAGR
jgi:excisionase family DNA binding protein